MSVDVIQHTTLHRKRGSAWSWTTRRIVVLIVVISGIIAASWLAPKLAASSRIEPAAPAQQMAAPAAPAATPNLTAVDVAADRAGPPVRAWRSQQSPGRTGIPLDAAVTPAADYEILSAAELEDISQARN